MKKLRLLQHFTWELPQSLLGLVLVLTLRAMHSVKNVFSLGQGRRQVWTTLNIGVSLGRYVIVRQFPSATLVRHERGHCKQSQLLGWLYLPVVGLPSITMNLLTRAGLLSAENYYKRWPESWADKLGGVDRKEGC